VRKVKHTSEVVVLDAERLLGDLDHLAKISGDSKEAGINRVAFSPADMEGRSWVATQMEDLGMEVDLDPAGNTIGVYHGSEEGLSPVALGSHTDSVPDGGKYDGALGVVSGLACVRALRDAGVRLRHPVEVINFSAEEATIGGGTFGSRAMADLLDPTVLDQVAPDGRLVSEHLAEAGLNPGFVTGAVRPEGALAAYMELHAEQGGVLDSAGVSVGTVEGIVGIRRYETTFEGFANHAGTTPMEGRRDALVLAAPFIVGVRDVAVASGIVGTVGSLRLWPGSPNVIPGKAVLSVELRGLREEDLDGAERELRGLAGQSGAGFERTSCKPPVASNPVVLAALESACKDLGLEYRRMVSGAGHDAMCMASITRQAMLFVPSKDGVSHSPEEYTDPESCVAGARVLLAALLRLDENLDHADGKRG
jgi:N-carbamoyl-L-amino-acid hydrolase